MKKSKRLNMYFVTIWISLFVLLFFADAWILKGTLFQQGALHPHTDEYWRYFTAGLLHQNLMHLLANCAAIYCIARLAKDEMCGFMMSLIMIMANVITYILFANLWSFSTSIGSSPGIYACIGFLLVVKMKKHTMIEWKSYVGNYLIWFAIIPQLQGFAACFVHGVGFIVGLIFGIMCPLKKSDSH